MLQKTCTDSGRCQERPFHLNCLLHGGLCPGRWTNAHVNTLCCDLELRISGPKWPQEPPGRVVGKGCPPPAQSAVDSEEGEGREGSRRQLTRGTSGKGSLPAHHGTDGTHSSSADTLFLHSENSTSSRARPAGGGGSSGSGQFRGALPRSLCFGCSEHSAP